MCPLPNDRALIFLIPHHVEITIISNGKDMRRQFPNPLVAVELDLFHGIQRQHLIWIDGYKNRACVGLKML